MAIESAPENPVAPVREKWLAYGAIGVGTGILSGLLGIGGAAILIPGMVELLGVSQPRAHGTSLFVMIPAAAVAAAIYASNNQMNWPLVVLFSVASMIGATLGARLMTRISAATLKRLFGLFLLFVAFRMIVPLPVPQTGADVDWSNLPMLGGMGLLGLVAGILSGLLGIGGGQVLIPGMVFLFAIDQKLAQGISLAFIVPTALSGTLTHHRRGNVLPAVGLLLIPGAIVGGMFGASIAQGLPNEALKQTFGFFLLYVGMRLLAPTFWGRLFSILTGRG